MAITALPTPPSRNDPTNFAERGDSFLAALPTFVDEANALETNVNAKEASATAAAQTATDKATAAATSETNAASNAGAAATSAANASASAAAAETSESNAATSASQAAASAASIDPATIVRGQFQPSGVVPTYASASSFTLPGNQTSEFHPGRRLQFSVTAGTVYGTIIASTYSSLTTVTVAMDDVTALDSGLSSVNLSVLRADHKALPAAGNAAVASGTADALIGAFVPAVTSLTNGLKLLVKAISANATTTPTFKADATTAKTIVKGNNLPLAAGDIAGAGHWLELTYDSTLNKWVLQNPAKGVKSEPYIYARDEKASGIAGGSSVAGIQTRTLNTEVVDTDGLATLSSNQIVLAAGTYRVKGRAPANLSNGHQIKLRNVTAGVTLLVGSTQYTSGMTDSTMSGRITVAANQFLELQHFTSSAQGTNGLGIQCSSGEVEVYAEIEFWKEA